MRNATTITTAPTWHPTATFVCEDCTRVSRIPARVFAEIAAEIRAEDEKATDDFIAATFRWCRECLTDSVHPGEHDAPGSDAVVAPTVEEREHVIRRIALLMRVRAARHARIAAHRDALDAMRTEFLARLDRREKLTPEARNANHERERVTRALQQWEYDRIGAGIEVLIHYAERLARLA